MTQYALVYQHYDASPTAKIAVTLLRLLSYESLTAIVAAMPLRVLLALDLHLGGALAVSLYGGTVGSLYGGTVGRRGTAALVTLHVLVYQLHFAATLLHVLAFDLQPYEDPTLALHGWQFGLSVTFAPVI